MKPNPLANFSLINNNKETINFPDGQSSLVCFVKEDCETCQTVIPIIEALHQSGCKILLIGQTDEGNKNLIEKHALSIPILNDTTLHTSHNYDIEIVPTIFRVNKESTVITRLEGFVKSEWQSLITELSNDTGPETSINADLDKQINEKIDWDKLPEWRPGCGSLSVQPENLDRIKAEIDNAPIRARKINISDDEFEFMFEQGFTDGLPVIPPTSERVLHMLSGSARDPQEVIATVAPNMGIATLEKVAINAVMAGCKPEYLPVVVAALEAACTDEFNIHGVMATTMGASPVIVVNGPIAKKIGMNSDLSALGQGNRANATIGRALRLIIRNIGGAVPGRTERPTLGNPMKFTMCFAEREERSPWAPMHVDRGFEANDSVVTIFGMTSGPTLIVDQTSTNPSQLARSMAMCLSHVHHPKSYSASDTLLVVCPEHLDTLTRGKAFSKEDLRKEIFDFAPRTIKDLVQDENSGVGISPEKLAAMPESVQNKLLNKFPSPSDIHIVVAGSDAGKFSGAFHGWVTGSMGTISTSKKIEVI